MNEKQIENAILRYLELLPDCFAWKNNSVGIYDPVKKIYRKSWNKYAINGVSDILGVYKGKALAIEVKTPKTKNKVSEAQKNFLYQFNKRGGLGFVASSVNDVKHVLENWCKL